LHGALHIGGDADVASDRQRAAAALLNLTNSLVQPLAALRGDDHRGAIMCEAFGDGAADAGTRAGDQRHLAAEAHAAGGTHGVSRSGTSASEYNALQLPCSICLTSARGTPRKSRARVTRLFGQSVPVCG